jgi:hypothetical protein
MKKILLIITSLFLIFIQQMKAQQWVSNGNNIYSTNSTGAVGIGVGTTPIVDPTYRLVVQPPGGGGIVIGPPDPGVGGFTALMLQISSRFNGYGSIQAIKSTGTSYGDLVLNNIAGNVGVGTDYPTALFSLGNRVNNCKLAVYDDGLSRVGLGFQSAQLRFHLNNTSSRFSFLAAENGGAELMTIWGNGNIGIGTTNPGSFRLAIEGGLGARSIKVLPTNVAWPDYVFSPHYKLLPLSELELYIKKNQHLPEIPSAKDVVENGIDVTEMTTSLLKKVEELTLYLIALKKENEQLKQSIVVLQEIANRK